MKNLGISFALAFIVSILFFCVLDFALGMEAHAAYGVAGLPLIASAHLYEVLERADGRKELAEPRPHESLSNRQQKSAIYTFDAYAISWPIATVYSILMLVSVLEFNSFLSGVLVSMSEIDFHEHPQSMIYFQFPLNLIAVYLIARWIGARGAKHGISCLLCTIVISLIFAHSFDLFFINADEFAKMFQHRNITSLILSGIFVFSIPAAIGYWRGTRMRLAKYLRYLMGILPEDTRDALITLAYEEANKIRTRRLAA